MMNTEHAEQSQILTIGKTPAQWVEIMATHAIEISERTLREKANDTGAFFRLGRTMLITPAQIDTITGMPLEIYKRGSIFWVKGWVEYNGRPIAGPYRQSTRATTEAGARDWINDETQLQIRRHLVGEEHSLRFADAVNFYPATAKDARQLLPILDQIGDMPLGAITGALLKSLGRKLKPNACTDT
jgi:hypothetical protein